MKTFTIALYALCALAVALAMLASEARQPAKPTRPDGGIPCDRFATQHEAQRFYEAHFEHWWTLDPLRTGIACAR